MSQANLPDRQMVSVDELKRAWAQVVAGGFRANTLGTPAEARVLVADPPDLQSPWHPAAGERVIPVLGCASATGATTLAVALASAIGGGSRVVECASATSSGLAAASTAELGGYEGGWSRGTRGQVLLERVDDVLTTAQEIPCPSAPDRPVAVTVLDIGWELGQVLTTPGWIGHVVRGPERVVLTTTATIPGMRRAVGAIELLSDVPVCLAVLGPRRKNWPKGVEHTGGPVLRALDQDGRLTQLPYDTSLAHRGVTGDPLPKPVLAAAHLLAQRLLGESTEGTSQ